ncbi:Glutathione peroxidase-like peroxiredoxin 2 [Vanrija pseudolonga]|uniref:Glutathione peroxidase n=1 Tax=Vanrija pseudolonga TaxID=143232 RepID=A0AAF0Y1K7_9TREE|nr:Glutathione peroxidase-like peroxiredoxin 2 [Vanrija pseudolonga]
MFSALKSAVGTLKSENIPDAVKGKSFYELKAVLPGKDKVLDFSTLKGKVVLIVNTASKCGFTPQYTGLEELYKEYHEQGLEVLGFPSNEFGGQEPGSDDDIASFCQVNHGVTFPLAKKSEVNGDNMNEVFAWLKAQPGGGGFGSTAIKWNFSKFLVSREGKLVGRYAPTTTPAALKSAIEDELKKA